KSMIQRSRSLMKHELDREEAAIRYFKQPGFRRFLTELKKKHEAAMAGARGYVPLSGLTEQERETLDGFYGTYTVPGQLEARKYSIAKFSRLLQESRFALTIPRLFQLLEGEL